MGTIPWTHIADSIVINNNQFYSTPGYFCKACGDYIVPENSTYDVCDDGNIHDGDGCSSTCIEESLYKCSENLLNISSCWLFCGDGSFETTYSEQCDDNNTVSDDGCDSTCQIEPGYSCNHTANSISSWDTICGDGLKAGLEQWDDANSSDSKGCENDWSGVIYGWYWGNGNVTTQDTWVTNWSDSIHAIGGEGWDDGNAVDSDGCDNSCNIEYKWSWRDDPLQRSVWQPMCGNGFNDHADEQWDDGNYDSGDGCSDQCVVEDTWEWINQDNDTLDQWYMQPKVTVSKISSDNVFTVTFSQKMVQFSPITDTDIEYWMTGPISNYQVTLESKFVDDYTVEIIVTTTTPFTGDNSEYLHLRFNETTFVSQTGVTLYNNETSGRTKKIPVYPDLVKAAGEGSNGLMTTSMVVIISSNVVLGQSSELLWAFINTIQIIYFMPLLSLYFPDHYSRFLTYITSARVQVDFIGFTEHLPQASDPLDQEATTPPLNQRYEDIGYDTTLFLFNANEMLTTVSSGIMTCIIVFSVKAIIITIRADVSPYKNMLKDIKKQENDNSDDEENDSEQDQRANKKKRGKWMRSKFKAKQFLFHIEKIKSMSTEYKYNFFIRLGIEVFLEWWVLTLLDIRYCKVDVASQIISFSLAIVFFIGCLYLLFYTAIFLKRNYRKMNEEGLEETASEVIVLFEEYKMKKSAISFNIIFFIRRLLYAMTIIFGYKYNMPQAIAFLILMASVFLYTVIVRPYKMSIINFFMVFNEGALMVLGIMNFLFINPITSEQKNVILGWICIGIILCKKL